MRFKEFFIEASIFNKPKRYSYGHKVIFSDGKKGQQLLTAIQDEIADFNPNEEFTWIPPTDEVYKIINFGRETTNTRYFERENGQKFGINGADSTIQSALNHGLKSEGSKAKNKGDASEPVLSSAVVAKLIKRGANNVEDITEEDVKYVFEKAVRNPQLTYIVNDRNSKVSDTIKFTIKVKGPIRRNLEEPDFWDHYGDLLQSVVHYANSGHMDRYADYFYKNGKVDMIAVSSDGVSDATTRKTDIEAYVRDDQGVVRKLKGLNISLKAGSPIIGQVSGGAEKADADSEKYMLYKAQELFGPIGINIENPDDIDNRLNFWVDAYKQAETQLKKLLRGKDSRKEAGVVFRLANFIKRHATNNDPSIHIVSLGKKGLSTIHGFNGIEHKLIDEKINLDCDLRIGKSREKKDPRPELKIFDVDSGSVLVRIRYSSTEDEGKIFNSISMEPLLMQLTTITYNKEKSKISGTATMPAAQPSPQEIEPAAVDNKTEPKPKPIPKKKEPVPTEKPVAVDKPEEPSPYSDQLSQFAKPQLTLSPRTDSTWRQKFKRR